MNNFRFFDFEVFKHWWCCVISDEEETYPGGMYNHCFTFEDEKRIKDKMCVITSNDNEERIKEFVEIMKEKILCGYNIKSYDMIIMKAVADGYSPEIIYNISNNIIENRGNGPNYKLNQYCKWGWSDALGFQDLMDDTTKGLKDKEASLEMDIRETTVPFDKEYLTEQDKKEIIFYCKHDVYALHVYYNCVKRSYIDTKIVLAKTFNLNINDAYKKTNATLSCQVLGANRVHGTSDYDPVFVIRDERLRNYIIKWVPENIYKILTTERLRLPDTATAAEKREFKEHTTFNFLGNTYVIGDGGLHSVYTLPNEDDALYVESTDTHTMFNIDASSFFPSIMIYCQSMSRAVPSVERFKEIYLRRMKLKATPKKEWTQEDKDFVAAAKLIMNTTYGAMGNKWLDIYDDYMRSKVCRIGQLMLIALGAHLQHEIPDLKIIQNNTDGILVYAKRNDYEKIKVCVDELSEISQFLFEIEEDDKLWQLDVNNYVAIHPDGEIKDKGGAFVTSIYQPGYNHCRPLANYIVPAAQIAYYKSISDNKPINPVQYIYNDTRVHFFVTTCTKGPGYSNMIQYNKDGVLELGKVARVIAVTDENYGIVKKRKTIKKATKSKNVGDIQEDTVALCPPHALVVNDNLANYKIENHKLIHIVTGESWDIDYAYYLEQLDKALNITWYEMKNDKVEFTEKFNI